MSPPVQTPAPAAAPTRMRYVPALDGLRALAVTAVVLYHLEAGFATGGFLGVEVFFVLSGYLITTLLLTERRRTGAIAVRGFWLRRARRLLPAVVALIAVVCALATVFWSTDVAGFRDDALASLLYVQNWWAIADQQPYFQQFGRPSPFMHLWSLAIEEQFYLVWPIVLALALRHLNKAKAFAITLLLAGLSLFAMMRFAHILHIERAYYGTDTRAFGLLLGSAMAFVWRPGMRLRGEGNGRARRVLEAVSLAALVGLIWQCAQRSEFDGWTFPWGLLWVDLLSMLVVAAAVVPRTTVSRVLGLRPFAAVGKRSYSLYLWHWPVIVFLRPGEDIALEGWPAQAVQVVVMVLLAELSFRFVERPWRTGATTTGGATVNWRPKLASLSPRPLIAGGVAGALLVAGVVVVALSGSPDGSSSASTVRVVASLPAQTASTTGPTTGSTAPDIVTTVSSPETTSTTTTVPETTTTGPPAPTPSTAPVSVIGESVTLAAEGAIEQRFPSAEVDAEVGRQFDASESRLEVLAGQGALSPTVVVHAGNNGPIPDGGLDELLDAVGDRRLILLTVSVPRRWESQVNDSIRSFVGSHPTVGLVDWKAAVQAEPTLVGHDGVHLTSTGIDRYVDLISQAVGTG